MRFLPLILIFSLSSCASYYRIEIHDEYYSGAAAKEDSTVNRIDEIINRYKTSYGYNKSYPVSAHKNLPSRQKRYFTEAFSFLPVMRINSLAVKCASIGDYLQAGILLDSAVHEGLNNGHVLNNLGVIYELDNNPDKAFEMYSRACVLDPDNEYFRWNFMCFQMKNDGGNPLNADR